MEEEESSDGWEVLQQTLLHQHLAQEAGVHQVTPETEKHLKYCYAAGDYNEPDISVML